MPFRLAIFILIVSTPLLAGQSSSSRAAPKADAVTAIIEAFGTSPVVALGEGDHGNEQGHAFRLGLIRDPRFAATVNDIVVESGNALYQDVMDRYVTGADVSSSELRLTWQNTTQLRPVWDVPIYEELFRAVREINTSLPAGRFYAFCSATHQSIGRACVRSPISSARCALSATATRIRRRSSNERCSRSNGAP